MNRTSTSSLAVIALLALFAAISCSNKSTSPSVEPDEGEVAAVPKITAAEPTHSFGKAKQGQNVDHVFKIKNEGKTDLLIEKARGS